MSGRTPDRASELRLAEIRREAERNGSVAAAGVRPEAAPFPIASATTGYYGSPLLKRPAWTWEVPLYFFVGGAAGASAIIAGASHVTRRNRDLTRDAKIIAALGAALSAPLLIADLGRPERFLNMLRVFKVRSPMSVGAWTLTVFGTAASAAAFASIARRIIGDVAPVRIVDNLSTLASAASGAAMASYTGVLIGATVVPVWNRNVGLLPIHFSASALGSAASLLQLAGHDERPVELLALSAAVTETVLDAVFEADRSEVMAPLHVGSSAALVRAGAILSGPLPALLRILGSSRRARRAAAVSSIVGSILTRYGWVAAGRASAIDPRAPMQLADARPVSERDG